MIVEMFGPAGSGKSSLSRALAKELSVDRIEARVVASDRPSDGNGGGGVSSALSRAAKLSTALRNSPSSSPLTHALLDMYRPRNPLWGLRYRRYLAQLDTQWRYAAREAGVVIFDQGYLCALASLVILSGRDEYQRLAAAVDLLPQPETLVVIDVPRNVIASRLATRLRCQSILERLFEMAPEVSLGQIKVVSEISRLMADRSQLTINVANGDNTSPEANATRISRILGVNWREASACAR